MGRAVADPSGVLCSGGRSTCPAFFWRRFALQGTPERAGTATRRKLRAAGNALCRGSTNTSRVHQHRLECPWTCAALGLPSYRAVSSSFGHQIAAQATAARARWLPSRKLAAAGAPAGRGPAGARRSAEWKGRTPCLSPAAAAFGVRRLAQAALPSCTCHPSPLGPPNSLAGCGWQAAEVLAAATHHRGSAAQCQDGPAAELARNPSHPSHVTHVVARQQSPDKAVRPIARGRRDFSTSNRANKPSSGR